MTATRITGVVALLVGGGLALHLAPAQQQSIKRTELQRHDLAVPGREKETPMRVVRAAAVRAPAQPLALRRDA